MEVTTANLNRHINAVEYDQEPAGLWLPGRVPSSTDREVGGCDRAA